MIIKNIFQHIVIGTLIYGYILTGIFGPSSVLCKHIFQFEKTDLKIEGQDDHSSARIHTWAMRRHVLPDNRLKITSDVVLTYGLVPEYKELHSVDEYSDYYLPTSSSHYTARPRDPPLP